MAPIQLQVKIPSYFRCPISLELMQDPVTLCTGMTYDRSSIERWIEQGNLSCPATMQTIDSVELLPNHTLRRLIQSWCVANKDMGVERIPTPKLPLDDNQVRVILDQIRLGYESKNFRSLTSNMKKLRNGAKENNKNLKCINEAQPSLTLTSIVDGLSAIRKHDDDAVEALEETMGLLSVVEFDEKSMNSMSGDEFLESISWVLRRGRSIDARINAAIIVQRFSNDSIMNTSIKQIDEILEGLVQLLDERSSRAIRSSLRALFALLMVRKNRMKAVALGAVWKMIELLPGADKGCTEDALSVLNLLCKNADGRASFAEHELGIFAVAKKIFRISTVATEYAVSILWSVCKYSPNESILRNAIEAKTFERLLLLLHLECSNWTKQKVCELLKILRNASIEEPCFIASPDLTMKAFVPLYPYA